MIIRIQGGVNIMEKYERVEFEVIEFTASDVITTSDCMLETHCENDLPIG